MKKIFMLFLAVTMLCSSVTVPVIAREVEDEYTDLTAYVRGEIHTEPEYEVFRLLVKGGLSEESAAGVLGNVDVETGGTFNPAAKSRTGYYGLAQWDPHSRKKKLVAWCGSEGYDYASTEGQVAFMLYEMETSYGKLYEHLLTCDDPACAAQEFAVLYEGCSGRTGHGDAAYTGSLAPKRRGHVYQALGRREHLAEEYFARYGNQ